MKKNRIILLSVVVLSTIIFASGFTKDSFVSQKTEIAIKEVLPQSINMFVTHGHCSTPFAGNVNDLKVVVPQRNDLGNPLEDMILSFEVDPNSFNVCTSEELTERIKTPGLFICESNEKITFRSTSVYTMGIDWYQVNGKMSIKGIEKDVKLFVSGIRNSKDQLANALVLEAKVNLLDWGIDYDKILTGTSDAVPTKWLHMNMKIQLSKTYYAAN